MSYRDIKETFSLVWLVFWILIIIVAFIVQVILIRAVLIAFAVIMLLLSSMVFNFVGSLIMTEPDHDYNPEISGTQAPPIEE